MQSNFEPKPSLKATKFYIHLNNFSEFLSWMSAGIAISFLVQLLPKFILLYPTAFVLTVGYFCSTVPHNPTASILRIVAIFSSLIGFWNLIWLHRDTFSAVAIAIFALLIIGGYLVWQKTK